MKVASYAGAAFGAYKGISTIAKGGGRNTVAGIGEVAGSIGLALGPTPLGIALDVTALAASVISSILGDPKAARANQIQRRLMHDQFFEPVARNLSVDASGNYADFDRFGMSRSSPFSPYPQIEEPYADYRHGVTVPGRTLNQFGGGGTQVTVVIHAMDGPSVRDLFLKNSDSIGEAVVRAVDTGHRVVPRMRAALGG